MDSETLFIPMRSRRETMDSGLVLASQGIEATIVKGEEGWGLVVSAPDGAAAREILQKWKAENRGWNWRQKVAEPDLFFHWGSLVWALGMLAMYYWSTVRYPGLKDIGAMNTQAFFGGQWWRLFTAVTLHGDLSHLIGNLSTGILLLGLAMARFRAGVALCATFLAGALGNLAAILVYPEVHQGLGASGMIMGALGLLATQPLPFWQKYHPATRTAIRALAAAVLFLVMVGFSPGTDIVAHLGGFAGGLALGYGLSWVDPNKLRAHHLSFWATAALIVWVIFTWWIANNNPPVVT